MILAVLIGPQANAAPSEQKAGVHKSNAHQQESRNPKQSANPAAVATRTPGDPAAAPGESATNSADQENEPRSFGGAVAHWRHVILWDPLAAFTVVLGMATLGLWLSTRRLWAGAERAEQPHMLIDTIKLSGMNEDAPDIQVQWEFRNHGKSPAWMQSISFGAYAGTSLPALRPKYDNLATLRHVVPQGSYFRGDEADADGNVVEIPQAIKYSVLAGEQDLFVYGTLIYRDVSKRRHETSFVYKLANSPETNWARLEPAMPSRYWRFS